MAVKFFLAFVTILACVEFLFASPTRRQLIAITEATASDSPATNEGEVWDDNDEFDLDGQSWYSQPIVSPSAVPEKVSDYNDDYDDDYASSNTKSNNHRNDNAMADFGEDDDEEETEQQEAEENVETNANDSEFLFLPPRDTRLVLEDDDDDSGPIKVRHTGRSSYPRVSDGADNSIESAEEEKEDNEHPYEFAIDEDDKDEDGGDDDDPHKDEGADTSPRHEVHDDDDDEDEFVSEGEENDMFDSPEEDAAQVIYGDHVFLY